MSFSETVTQQILQRRERLDIYDSLVPEKTALIVVDMQNAFCAPDSPMCVPDTQGIVGNINRLAHSLRGAGGSVYWVQMKIQSEADWPHYLGGLVSRRANIEGVLKQLSPSGTGVDIFPPLEVHPSDTLVSKNRFSAFLPRACSLMEQLEQRGIDTVIITGTLTNVCSESSARDAAMHDYKVLFVSDANAARDRLAHQHSLESIAQCFGDVRDTDGVVALIEAARG
jgi:ureidoacrylate peracid hydrolase